MATGDFTVFDEFFEDLMEKVHDFETPDDIKLAFITSATTPAATTADPHFGGTGTTDLSTNETTGGNVSAGGVALAGETSALSGGAGVFDSDDITIAANASNPADVRWGILYNNTHASKACIGYLDFGGDTSFVNGFTITINSSGWLTIDQA